jgi:site-specific DNA recombinase
MKRQLRIGAYLRVSTDKQVQVFEGSLDTQKYRMVDFVKSRNRESRGWGDIIDFYIDEGISAQTTKRPQYQRLMADVRSGKVNLILVADISRLSRNVHDFSILLKELEKYNASYMSLKEQFDTTTPAGRLMTNMVVTMAQFEREQTSERVSINCNSRAVRGFVNGGRAPLGFKRDDSRRGVLVVDENEAEQVRTIFRVFMEQGSVGKALPVIESLGIFPKSADSAPEESKVRSWNPSVVREILINPVYIGLREVNKMRKDEDPDHLKPWQKYQLVKATWPAIVDSKTFENTQAMLEENLKLERRRLQDAEARIFILSGILRCGECGRPLCGQSAHGRMSVHRYYGHADKRVKSSTCSLSRLRADEVEQVVINHFTEIASRVGYFKAIEEKIKTFVDAQPKSEANHELSIRRSLKAVEKEIASAFRMQGRLNPDSNAFELAADHLEELASKKKTLRSALDKIERTQSAEIEPQEIVGKIQERITEVRKGFSKAPPAMRRRLMRKLIKELVYTSEGLEVHFNVDECFDLNSNVVELNADRKRKAAPEGGDPELSLSFRNLPISGNGWGSRTRTCE